MYISPSDVARGLAHQTSQRTNVVALNQSRHVKVADGGAVGIVERGAVALAGLQVERQRIALSVERTLERVTARACHLRRTDACGEFHGFAAEAVGHQAAIQGVAEPVPAVGGLDGIFVGASLLEVAGVGFRERCVKGERLANHSERVGAVVFVGDTVADAHVRLCARQGKRCHGLASYRREGDGDIIACNGWFRAEAELRIIAGDSSVVDFEVLIQRVLCAANGDSGRGGVGAYFVFALRALYARGLVGIDDADTADGEARAASELLHVERGGMVYKVIGGIIDGERQRGLTVGEAALVIGGTLGAGSGQRVAAGGDGCEVVAGVVGGLNLGIVGHLDVAFVKSKSGRAYFPARRLGEHDFQGSALIYGHTADKGGRFVIRVLAIVGSEIEIAIIALQVEQRRGVAPVLSYIHLQACSGE